MSNKKWIKLKADFFNQDSIDYLLGQKNGANYVVLYQMLCLQAAKNGDNKLEQDINKIVRYCKYFDKKTIINALWLFQKLGLISEDENNAFIKEIE